jgi:CubicO group peptidase (beta-lactamase class C family)
MHRTTQPASTPTFPVRASLAVALLLLGAGLATPGPLASQSYVPGRHPDWERRTPQQVGFDPAKLQAAIEFSIASESKLPRDLSVAHFETFGREPLNQPVGPFRTRGPQTGLVIRHGYLVAEWGEPDRVDMTFSVTKTFVSTMAGLAFDRGMIRSVDDPVRSYFAPLVLDEGDGEPGDQQGRRPKLLFESEHNRTITWNHLLRQTSDWEGTLWGKPEWADRPTGEPSTWRTRPRVAAGTVYEYNDTRINVLALSLQNIWRRPLPEVLRELVMDPIGASPTWRWVGYDNSWIALDGLMVQAVGGGGHWGGGMFINAYDQARIGLLTLWRGKWGDRQIFSEDWYRKATTPGPANEGYGYCNYFLNTGQKSLASAPASAFTHRGNGANIIYVDPANDLVVVTRWIDNAALDAFIGKVLDALDGAVRK